MHLWCNSKTFQDLKLPWLMAEEKKLTVVAASFPTRQTATPTGREGGGRPLFTVAPSMTSRKRCLVLLKISGRVPTFLVLCVCVGGVRTHAGKDLVAFFLPPYTKAAL